MTFENLEAVYRLIEKVRDLTVALWLDRDSLEVRELRKAENKLWQLEDELYDLQRVELGNFLKTVAEGDVKRIIRFRYCRGMSWEDIAERFGCRRENGEKIAKKLIDYLSVTQIGGDGDEISREKG